MRQCSPPPLCHISQALCHMSHVTCHLSCVTFFSSSFFFFFKLAELFVEGSVFNGAPPSSFCKEFSLDISRENYVLNEANRKCHVNDSLALVHFCIRHSMLNIAKFPYQEVLHFLPISVVSYFQPIKG